jgi:hypothetical protein
MRRTLQESSLRRRSRAAWLLWALVGSALLHLVLFELWSGEVEPAAARPQGELVEFEVARPGRPKTAPIRPERTSPQRRRSGEAAAPAQATAPPEAERRSDTPRVARPQPGAPIVLTPSTRAFPWSAPPPLAGGQTLHPDDQRFSPEVKREEERARVHQRVQTFLEDELGQARAQRGLAHPYLGGLREALLADLGTRGAITPRQLGGQSTGGQAFLKSYLAAAEAYGRTGNPGLPPPGAAPTQSELLAQRFGGQPGALPAQAQAQATEGAAAFSSGNALFRMTVEVVQTVSPPSTSVNLAESSGNPVFDGYVLRSFEQTLAKAEAPPRDALHGGKLKSVWRVEGWFRPKRHPEDSPVLSMLPSPQGVPVNQLMPADQQEVEFHAKLLRAQ